MDPHTEPEKVSRETEVGARRAQSYLMRRWQWIHRACHDEKAHHMRKSVHRPSPLSRPRAASGVRPSSAAERRSSAAKWKSSVRPGRRSRRGLPVGEVWEKDGESWPFVFVKGGSKWTKVDPWNAERFRSFCLGKVSCRRAVPRFYTRNFPRIYTRRIDLVSTRETRFYTRLPRLYTRLTRLKNE